MAIDSPKAEEDNRNKENINDSRELIVLQPQLALFPGSRNEQVVLNCC